MEKTVAMLRHREDLYRRLLDEADSLLTDIGSVDEDRLLLVMSRRQEILDSIQKIDSGIASRRNFAGTAPTEKEERLLREFADRRKSLTDRILQTDALAAALAGERLAAIRGELAGLARGRTALQGYDACAKSLAG